MADFILKPEILIHAYAQGFFPMPDPDTGKIVWLKPDPRAVIPLDGFHCSRSLKKRLSRQEFRVTFDTAFLEVMQGCANREESWITPDFFRGYTTMFDEGLAHSVEVWKGDRLVGGLYGISLNGAFFAESKFHVATDASKVALFHLVRHLNERGFTLLEVQFLTPHLQTLGAQEISAEEYERRLAAALEKEVEF